MNFLFSPCKPNKYLPRITFKSSLDYKRACRCIGFQSVFIPLLLFKRLSDVYDEKYQLAIAKFQNSDDKLFEIWKLSIAKS